MASDLNVQFITLLAMLEMLYANDAHYSLFEIFCANYLILIIAQFHALEQYASKGTKH